MFNYNVFKTLMEMIAFNEKTDLIIDFGNGVGRNAFPEILREFFNLTFINEFDLNHLNHNSGAEFVQKDFAFPLNYPKNGVLCASFDGDADRIVYSFSDNGKFMLLDGGKICLLYAQALNQMLTNIEADENLKDFKHSINFKVIQTAYSNGSTFLYFKEKLQIDVFVAPTGFKYLEREAKNCDIGLAFEPNGHGTIFYKQDVLNRIQSEISKSNNLETKKNLKILLYFLFMSNQATGDAIMNTFSIEFALRFLNLSGKQWSDFYVDMESLTTKIYVKDKYSIKTTWDEQKVLEPLALQSKIDALLSLYESSHARAFVRPSGTENLVRLYIESTNSNAIKEIEKEIRQFFVDLNL